MAQGLTEEECAAFSATWRLHGEVGVRELCLAYDIPARSKQWDRAEQLRWIQIWTGFMSEWPSANPTDVQERIRQLFGMVCHGVKVTQTPIHDSIVTEFNLREELEASSPTDGLVALGPNARPSRS